mgnify:CR=1 FL=1
MVIFLIKDRLGGLAMRRAVCPGSFDPVTKGHIDIFERASAMFDELIISVFHNPGKDKAMFSMEERVEMLREATKHIPNVRVTCFSGLLNEFCKRKRRLLSSEACVLLPISSMNSKGRCF